MRPGKSIALFLLRLLVINALLLTPWLGFPWLCRHALVVGGTLVFGWFGSEATVRLEVQNPVRGGEEVEVILFNRRTNIVGTAALNSRDVATLPAAFLASLVLATPLSWRRRLHALAWAAPAMLAYAALRLGLMLVQLFGNDDSIRLFDPTSTWRSFVVELDNALASPVVAWFVIPILLWIALTFRRGDRALLESRTPGP